MGVFGLFVEQQLTILGEEEGIFIMGGHLKRETNDNIFAYINYSIVLFENYSFGSSSTYPIMYYIEEEDWSFRQICTCDMVSHFYSKGIHNFDLIKEIYYLGEHYREPVYLTFFFNFGKFNSSHYKLYFIREFFQDL